MSEPKGVPGEAKRFQLNLTSADLRSGIVHLPASMVDLFDSGPVTARDADTGDSHTLNFEAPRQIGGLSPFFAKHELGPNDALIFIVARGDLQLSALRRPRQQRPVAGSSHRPAPQADETSPPAAAEPPRALFETPIDAGDDEFQYIRVIRRQSHIERPRPADLAAPKPTEPSRQEAQGAAPPPSEQPAQPGDDEAEVLPWKRRRVERGASALDEVGSGEPAADRVEGDRRPLDVDSRHVEPAAIPEEAPQPRTEPQTGHGRRAEAPPVKGGRPEAMVARFLSRPDTPTIVKTDHVAERLGLTMDGARTALDALAGVPDSGVRRVKPDSYLVSQRVLNPGE